MKYCLKKREWKEKEAKMKGIRKTDEVESEEEAYFDNPDPKEEEELW